MKKFETPSLEIEKFTVKDVITTSCGEDEVTGCDSETMMS